MSAEMDSAFVLWKYRHYFQSLRDKDNNDLVSLPHCEPVLGFVTLMVILTYCIGP